MLPCGHAKRLVAEALLLDDERCRPSRRSDGAELRLLPGDKIPGREVLRMRAPLNEGRTPSTGGQVTDTYGRRSRPFERHSARAGGRRVSYRSWPQIAKPAQAVYARDPSARPAPSQPRARSR